MRRFECTLAIVTLFSLGACSEDPDEKPPVTTKPVPHSVTCAGPLLFEHIHIAESTEKKTSCLVEKGSVGVGAVVRVVKKVGVGASVRAMRATQAYADQ